MHYATRASPAPGPVGHGYAVEADGSRLYYSYPLSGAMLAISLDTTNQAGGADGSIGTEQLEWLEREDRCARGPVRRGLQPPPVVRDGEPHARPAQPRGRSGTTGDRGWSTLLQRLPERRRVGERAQPPGTTSKLTRRTFWEINSASHIDAPHQARVIEVARNGDGTLSIFTTMVDADAPGPHVVRRPGVSRGLAGLYREIAFNDLDLARTGAARPRTATRSCC